MRDLSHFILHVHLILVSIPVIRYILSTLFEHRVQLFYREMHDCTCEIHAGCKRVLCWLFIFRMAVYRGQFRRTWEFIRRR